MNSYLWSLIFLTGFQPVLFVTFISVVFLDEDFLHFLNFTFVLLCSCENHLKVLIVFISQVFIIMCFQKWLHLALKDSCLLLIFSASAWFYVISNFLFLKHVTLNALGVQIISYGMLLDLKFRYSFCWIWRDLSQRTY